MAGTLFGLPLSQPVDLNGKPQVGCRLYITAAGSFTTAAVAYKDFALTAGQEHPYPIPSDAWGRLPIFWLADGNYAFRLVDGSGVVLSSALTVQALGPSSGSGGGGSSVDPNALIQTGDVYWQDVQGTRAGFVRDNARTIGSATSGATERASGDVAALYNFLWNTFPNSFCAVTGGRGISSAADFSANKPIQLPDKRGMTAFGLDDMGNVGASRFPSAVPFFSGNATTPGSIGGEPTHALTANENGPHSHGGVTGGQSAPHTHDVPAARNSTGFTANPAGGAVNDARDVTVTSGPPSVDHHHGISSDGLGTAHNNMPTFVLGTFYRKL